MFQIVDIPCKNVKKMNNFIFTFCKLTKLDSFIVHELVSTTDQSLLNTQCNKDLQLVLPKAIEIKMSSKKSIKSLKSCYLFEKTVKTCNIHKDVSKFYCFDIYFIVK